MFRGQLPGSRVTAIPRRGVSTKTERQTWRTHLDGPASSRAGILCQDRGGRRALARVSRVWFTVSHGILNEIYYPRVDQACTRDFGLIVTDDDGFFAEEKRDCSNETRRLEDGVPAFLTVSTHFGGRFRITKTTITDPRHDTVLQQVHLEVLQGPPLRLFALLAPHLVNAGAHNTAWVGRLQGPRACCSPRAAGHGSRWPRAGRSLPTSVGFVGVSDGWQILHAHGQLTEQYDRAADGNVALTAELPVNGDEPILLAIGFGRSGTQEASFHAHSSLQVAFASTLERYTIGWRSWQATLRSLDRHVGRRTTAIASAPPCCASTKARRSPAA